MGLSPGENEAQTELAGILSGPNADALYNELDGSLGGRVLNADLARNLSPHYQCRADRIAFTKATYPPCSNYVLQRFYRTVKNKEWRHKTVLFLAGGAASGKTTSIGKEVMSRFDLVFDSNMAGYEKARKMLDAATIQGWEVSLLYIHRNFRSAARDMLSRAVETGRYVPFTSPDGDDLASLHFNAQRTFAQLAAEYADNEKVIRAAVRNPWEPGNPQPISEIGISTPAAGGKRHYTEIQELYAVQQEILHHALVQQEFPDGLVQALGVETEA